MPQVLDARPLDMAAPQLTLHPRLHAAASSALAAVHSGASIEDALGLVLDDVRRACAIARDQGVPAQRVTAILREGCRTAPDSQRVRWVAADLVRTRLVTLCVLIYYVEDGA
jgi:hypothetical protein